MVKEYKKKTYKKKTAGRMQVYGAAASQLYKDVKYLKDMVNVESKEFIQPIIGTQYSNSGTNGAFGLCYPGQGISRETRVGDSIKLQHLMIRGDMSKGAAAYSQVRMIIFKGKSEDNKTYTIGGDILQDNGIAGAYAFFLSTKKLDEMYNTKILYDKVFTIDSAKTNIIPFRLKLKLGWHQRFIKGTNTIMDGGLYMVFVSNQPVAADAPVINFTAVTQYTDD